MRVQDQTEPLVEPALMWSPRETLERKNGPCIRRNFGAAQEQACKTCCCGAEWGHRRWQHANTTEFFGSDSRNLLNLMLAATVYIKVPVESACIMLLGFRVRLLGLRVAWCTVGKTADRSMRTRQNFSDLIRGIFSTGRWQPLSESKFRSNRPASCCQGLGLGFWLHRAHFCVSHHLHPHLLRTVVIVVHTCCEVSRTEMAQACTKWSSPFPPSPSAPVAQPLRRDDDMQEGVRMLGEYLAGALSARPLILFRRFGLRFAAAALLDKRSADGPLRTHIASASLFSSSGLIRANQRIHSIIQSAKSLQFENMTIGPVLFSIGPILAITRRLEDRSTRNAILRSHIPPGC